jgi:hemerythrin superfamily protein
MPRVASRTPQRRKTLTALDLLKSDHAEVKRLFKQFERFHKSGDSDGMQQVAQAACRALGIHAQIEEEIFYPALREGADAKDALDEADVEHSHIKELVGQLEASRPADRLFAARFTVLSEYVQHHVEEEESTIFSKARKAECDLIALGEQLLARKAELGTGGEPLPDVIARRQAAAPKRNGQRVTR